MAEYMLALTEPGATRSYESVGSRTSWTLDEATSIGTEAASRELSVRASNPTGTCTSEPGAANAMFKLVDAPSGGTAAFEVASTSDAGFLRNRSSLAATWSITQSPLDLSYEACVGTRPYECQVAAYAPAASPWRIDSLSLPCGVDYFLNGTRDELCRASAHGRVSGRAAVLLFASWRHARPT